MDYNAQNAEVDRNYNFFQRHLSGYLRQNAGRYALLRHAALVGFFDTPREALDVAKQKFDDGIYSLQEVTAEPIDLGIFSHAGS